MKKISVVVVAFLLVIGFSLQTALACGMGGGHKSKDKASAPAEDPLEK